MLARNPSLRPWGTAFILVVAGLALLIVGAMSSMVLVVIGAVVFAVGMVRGLYFGERAASDLSQGPDIAPGRSPDRR